MRVGDRALFHHSVVGTAVVGICEVVREAYPDPPAEEPRWVAVDLAPVKKLRQPPTLRDIPLLRQSQLGVMPLESQACDTMVKLGGRAAW